MGKLTIIGEAYGEYKLDLMDIEISFHTEASSPSQALKKVLSQCETFLSILHDESVPRESVRLNDDKVEDNSYRDDGKYEASRSIIIRVPFDIIFKNRLLEILTTNKFTFSLNSEEKLSNEQEIRHDLIKKALENSRQKAEFVADSMGQKITGIDTVNIGRNISIDYKPPTKYDSIPCGSMPYSNDLENPLLKLSESVTVVWIME